MKGEDMVTGCLKLGGDPILGGQRMEIVRDMPEETVVRLIAEYGLKEFKVEFPLLVWPTLRCGKCDGILYCADTIEKQMCWTHINSSLVVEDGGKQKVFLLCGECAGRINQGREMKNSVEC